METGDVRHPIYLKQILQLRRLYWNYRLKLQRSAYGELSCSLTYIFDASILNTASNMLNNANCVWLILFYSGLVIGLLYIFGYGILHWSMPGKSTIVKWCVIFKCRRSRNVIFYLHISFSANYSERVYPIILYLRVIYWLDVKSVILHTNHDDTHCHLHVDHMMVAWKFEWFIWNYRECSPTMILTAEKSNVQNRHIT